MATDGGTEVIALEDERTSGLEDLIDWDDLELLLKEDRFATRQEVRNHVGMLLCAQGEPFPLSRWLGVLAGLFPEYRELYEALPDRPNFVSNAALTPLRVVEIRSRSKAGESAGSLAAECGVSVRTLRDVINYKTWKDVA